MEGMEKPECRKHVRIECRDCGGMYRRHDRKGHCVDEKVEKPERARQGRSGDCRGVRREEERKRGREGGRQRKREGRLHRDAPGIARMAAGSSP